MNETKKALLLARYGHEPSDFPEMDYELLEKLEDYVSNDTKVEHSFFAKPNLEIHLKEKKFGEIVRSILNEHKDAYHSAFVHNPVDERISSNDLEAPLAEHISRVIESIRSKDESLYVFNVLIVCDEEFGLTLYWNTEEAHEKNILGYQEKYGEEYKKTERIYSIKHNQGDFSYADHEISRVALDSFFDDYNRAFNQKNPDWEAPSYDEEKQKAYKLLIQSAVKVLKETMDQFSQLGRTSDFKCYVDGYDLDSELKRKTIEETACNLDEKLLNFIAN